MDAPLWQVIVGVIAVFAFIILFGWVRSLAADCRARGGVLVAPGYQCVALAAPGDGGR